MKRKLYWKILAIGIIVLFVGVSVTSANRVEKKKNIAYKSGGEIESGFMIGIMYVKHIKKGWGWEEVWTPIYIIEYGQTGKKILRPSSGSFTPYDIDGFLGPAYCIFRYPSLDGPFLIYANVIVWEEE